MKNINHMPVVAIALALTITGCGGGSGATTPNPVTAPSPVPAPAPSPSPASLQLAVPALTYSVGSQEYVFVTELNAFRAQVGLGLLAQNSFLDKAAGNHLAYILKNDLLLGGTVDMRVNDPVTGRSQFHIEGTTKPLFTGVSEADRAKAVGYTPGYVGEEITFGGGKGATLALKSLVATVYHRAGLMFQPPMDVGVAVGTDTSQSVVMLLGFSNATQVNGSDYVGVYPADKQTGVSLSTHVEVPNPFPELSLITDDFPTKTGYPISISIVQGNVLKVTEFEMTEAGLTGPLDSRIMHRDNDPNKYLDGNVAFLIAKSRLKPSTNYQVRFVGTNNGLPLARSWTFTTTGL